MKPLLSTLSYLEFSSVICSKVHGRKQKQDSGLISKKWDGKWFPSLQDNNLHKTLQQRGIPAVQASERLQYKLLRDTMFSLWPLLNIQSEFLFLASGKITFRDLCYWNIPWLCCNSSSQAVWRHLHDWNVLTLEFSGPVNKLLGLQFNTWFHGLVT